MTRRATAASLTVLWLAAFAGPVAAQDLRAVLYGKGGAVVSGISYCYAVMSGREGLDSAARKRGLVTPTDASGRVYPTEKPRPKRRTWIRTYSGPQAGTAVKPEPSDLSLIVRYRETKCEVEVWGVPHAYGPQIVPVTTQVFAKLSRKLTLEIPFRKVLVAGKGPSWHGGLYFTDPKFSGGVSYDVWRKGFGVWGVDLTRSDILKKKYGG